MGFTVYPQTFEDAYAQTSDIIFGRRLSVIFDTNNIVLDTDETFLSQVIVTVNGLDYTNSIVSEDFFFNRSGERSDGSIYFVRLDGINISGLKIFASEPYGAVEVKEYKPISEPENDGYKCIVSKFGSGIFVVTDAYGDNYDPGHGSYEFKYSSPMNISLDIKNENIFFGNKNDLNYPLNGIIDEIKITSITSNTNRTINSSSNYSISREYYNPIENVPNSKILTLIHCNDNSAFIVNEIRDPLSSAFLTDEELNTIVSLRNSRSDFISYVDSLGITGSIVDGVIDERKLSEQLYDLVSSLNILENSANYLLINGKFFPSDTIPNLNFINAGLFTGNQYSIVRNGLLNNTGSIELWISPLFNTYGDLKSRTYIDIFNHIKVGQNGTLKSSSTYTIELPANIRAKKILSVLLYNDKTISGTMNNYAIGSKLSNDGSLITLNLGLPSVNEQVIIDYIPLSDTNNRIHLYKNEGSELVFSMEADNGIFSVSHDISKWLKDSWHRVMVNWKINSKLYKDRIYLFVDGVLSNTSYIDLKNIVTSASLDTLHIGTNYTKEQNSLARMSNLRVSSIERDIIVDARGTKRDLNFGGGYTSANPVISDINTLILENFDPNDHYVSRFASVANGSSGKFDIEIDIFDKYHLIRGIGNGIVEKLLKELIKIIKPAHARTKIRIVD